MPFLAFSWAIFKISYLSIYEPLKTVFVIYTLVLICGDFVRVIRSIEILQS